MESRKNFITGRQLITVLLITRLAFSSTFIAGIGAGHNVQDIIWAIPVMFITNLIVAGPILLFLKRHPGKDLMECFSQCLGKPLGILLACFYFFLFVGAAALIISTFNCFFSINFLSESFAVTVGVPLLLVGIYGAVKGIEPICRFGTLALILYLLTLLIIFAPATAHLKLGYFSPMFYSGQRYFLRAVAAGVTTGLQPMVFAMCAPYVRPEEKLFKTYVLWDLFATVLLFALFFYLIGVMGPFLSVQMFPLQSLAMMVQLGGFERIDSVVLISWVCNTVLELCLYLYAASQCLLRTPIKKYRRSIIFAAGVLALLLSLNLSRSYLVNLPMYFSPNALLAVLLVLFVLPLAGLIVDLVKDSLAGQPHTGKEA